jgi:carboxypeptidase family protein
MHATRAGLIIAILASATPALAQGSPTGAIAGRVADKTGLSVPGVAVSATSPNLQGGRSMTTSIRGDYLLPLLPPGDYTVRFELNGFKAIEEAVKVVGAQTLPLNVTLEASTVTETIAVAGTPADSLMRTSTASTTFKQDAVVSRLPTDRRIDSTAALAAGVLRAGPSSVTTGLGALSISGGVSSENLFLVNGVVVNDNVRGQPIDLYVEDAIQETTVSTSAISAELGRFSGGVVNAVTKSGGNLYGGSFRGTLEHGRWRTVTPFGEPRTDGTRPAYEFTLGGPILRDRTWFFTAGRLMNQQTADATAATRLPFERTVDQRRYEVKLTQAVTPLHTARGSYLRRNTRTTNDRDTESVMDLASLTTHEDPDTMWSLGYTGILSARLFLEAQYARRASAVKGNGSRFTDLINGTVLVDNSRGGARYNSPAACGVCPPEERNNRDFAIKGTYYWSAGRLGSHNLVFGYDTFNDIRIADSHQSGSDYRILGTGAVIRDSDIFPVFDNDGRSTLIQFNPIPERSHGTDFVTRSAFVNDQWRVNDAVLVNVGVRLDRNVGHDASNAPAATSAKVSPRLSVTYDPTGAGVWSFNAGYATYVAAIANAIANSASSAGNPATFRYAYLGPPVNVTGAGPLLSRAQAIQTVFDWFFANGGTTRPATLARLPGVNTMIAGSLESPSVAEWTGGVTRRIGTRGLFRADVVSRRYADFYATRIDRSTGRATNDLGQVFDVRLIENTNDVTRRYWGVNTALHYRASTRVELGAAYTISRTWGNVDAENAGSGPVTAGPRLYPEFIEPSWNFPEGDLATDQRHKARLWGIVTAPMRERYGILSLGVLESLDSGLPFGAVGTIDSSPFVVNPGYLQPPAAVTYYFTPRDAFRTDASTRTDLALNYAFRLGPGRLAELFVRGDVTNVFNQHAIVNPAFLFGTVLTRSTDASYLPFDPFTTRPVRGVHWDLAPNFFTPTSRFAYQPPRQFRIAVGARF